MTTTNLFIETITWLAWMFAIVSLADLICGFVHWFEDNYGNEDWPFIGDSIIAPNRLHHSKPRAFTANNWWQSASVQVLASATVIATSLWGGWFSWGLVLLVALATNGNEIHKCSHRSRAENGPVISWLQNCGIVQSRRHHANHHRGQRNTHFCSITNWVNPVLDKTRFWRGLEFCIFKCTGVVPRVDPDVKPLGSDTATQ